MRGSITSIRQAVMMLGSRGVSRWALLVFDKIHIVDGKIKGVHAFYYPQAWA
jgi:HD-like signal output (HDOD) protein